MYHHLIDFSSFPIQLDCGQIDWGGAREERLNKIIIKEMAEHVSLALPIHNYFCDQD